MKLTVPLSVVLALLVAASPASALDVTSANGEMRVEAAAGESNAVQLSSDARDFMVSVLPPAKLSAGGNCSLADSTVRCSRAGVASIVVNLGDMPDQLSLSLPYSTNVVPVSVSGGDGFDSVEYEIGGGPVEVSLDGQPNDGPGNRGDNIQPGVESLGGTLAGDTLVGSGLADRLIGLGGRDTLSGLGGPDYIDSRDFVDCESQGQCLHAERDVVSCGEGADIADGDSLDQIDPDCELVARSNRVRLTAGSDQLTGWRVGLQISGAAGDDTLKSLGRGSLAGGSGDDVLRSGGRDRSLDGGSGDDRIFGSFSNDHLAGGYGNDKLHGRSGSDFVSGGAGRDELSGGPGNDRIVSRERGAAPDRVSCGRGRDVVIAGRHDVIDRSCERVERR